MTHYFDARRVCRKCGRPFLFFAEEQKHWYEALMFPLEADCLDCPPCRKDEQRLRAIRQKYDALLAKRIRTQAETLELVECGLFLVESVLFSAKLLPRLRGLLKPLLLAAEEPHYTRAKALMSAINGSAAK
ncbi:MAG TPA: zinc-ribbon domain containing protein [Burkholderiales bacterium]|nr:zinc-ribbon domain containing protein [Burkholderiales bacterium]